MEVYGKSSQANGPKAERDKTERARGLLAEEQERRYIDKWDQTGSPEIPERGETSEIPGLPSGLTKRYQTLTLVMLSY